MAWNIQHGGGSRIKNIVQWIDQSKADVIVLTEYRKTKQELTASLRTIGFTSFVSSNASRDGLGNEVLIASKLPEMIENGWIVKSSRAVSVTVGNDRIHLLGIHIPGSTDSNGLAGKMRAWDEVILYAKKYRNEPCLILGDFNTGLAIDSQGTPFAASERINHLLAEGFTDIWRDRNPTATHYTWFSSSGNGFRLDAAFATKEVVPKVQSISYRDEPRVIKLSDHSAMVLDVQV